MRIKREKKDCSTRQMALLNKTNDEVNYNQQTHILISFFDKVHFCTYLRQCQYIFLDGIWILTSCNWHWVVALGFRFALCSTFLLFYLLLILYWFIWLFTTWIVINDSLIMCFSSRIQIACPCVYSSLIVAYTWISIFIVS